MGAATVSMLAIAPVFAAAPVSQASSNALTLSIAGNPISSGTVKATNDGDDETKTGETNPVVGVLGNQNLLNVGVLAQEAQAKVAGNGDGTSAACGGVAGEGAGFGANVGDSNCLTPGDPVGLSIANLDLTGSTVIDPTSAIGGLAALNPFLAQLLGPVTNALSSALAPLGDTGLGGTLGAVYSHCTAVPGSAEGGANIVDSKLTLSIAGNAIDLVNLPANPPPNTHVLTDLDAVLNAVLDGLRTNLNTTLDGLLGPVGDALIPAVQTNLVNTLVAQVADALAPLEENILDITLNKQTKTADTIEITALDLQLLPVAAQFIGGSSLVAAEIGTVSCGPNGKKVVDEPTPTPTDDPTPEVPTVVDSGVRGSGSNTARDVLVATGALMLLAGTAGLIGYRRMLVK